MIIEQPVIELIDVEILTPVGGFILGKSFLNIDDLGDPATDLVWSTYLADATSVKITRGGRRSGLATTMQVGTLDMTLVNAGDPADNPFVKPNSPIRVRAKGSDVPLFTGVILDVDMEEQLDKAKNVLTDFITISAVDAVQVHANTNRYGAVSGVGFEGWEARIARLAASSLAPINPPSVNEPIVKYSL